MTEAALVAATTERDEKAPWFRPPTPYQAGNLEAVKSGAWSPRLVTETMEQLRPELQRIIDMAPWLLPIDEHALVDYLRDMARLERLETWLAEHGERYSGDHDKDGELRDRDLMEVTRIRRRCMDHRSRLGLDPVSRARMNLDRVLAFDVAALMAGDEADEADEAASG